MGCTLHIEFYAFTLVPYTSFTHPYTSIGEIVCWACLLDRLPFTRNYHVFNHRLATCVENCSHALLEGPKDIALQS